MKNNTDILAFLYMFICRRIFFSIFTYHCSIILFQFNSHCNKMKYNLFVTIFMSILIISIIVIIVVLIVNRSHPHPNTHGGPHPNTPGGPYSSIPASPGSPRVLFLIPEAFGFDVPELKASGEIIPPKTAKNYFDKVIVCANSATYVAGNNNSNPPTPPNNVMTAQWDHPIVKDLGLPIEKWAFVCCDDPQPGKAATELIPNLLSDYSDITGFLMDFEDPTSVDAFINVFKTPSYINKYKYGIIGYRGNLPGWVRWSTCTLLPGAKIRSNPCTAFSFDYYFNELYTEGMYDGMKNPYYNVGDKASLGNAVCPKDDNKSIQAFWESASISCDGNKTIPTVCGSGNCQEVIWTDDFNKVVPKNNSVTQSCFDERLSGKFILDLLDHRTAVQGGNFAIWYGTGQAKSINQLLCTPNIPKPIKAKPIYWGCANDW